MGELTTRQYLVLGTELAEELHAEAGRIVPAPGGLREIRRRIRGASPLTAWLRALAERELSDAELKAAGRAAVARVTHNQAGAADCRPAAPVTADHLKGISAMTNHRTSKHPMSVMIGEVIIEHPDTGEPGCWAVAHPPVRFGDKAEIEVRSRTGGRERFTVDISTHVKVRPRLRHAVIEGLRELATFLEDHPHAPTSGSVRVDYFASLGRHPADAVGEVDRVAALLGVAARRSGTGRHYEAVLEFGAVEYRAIAVNVLEADRAQENGAST